MKLFHRRVLVGLFAGVCALAFPAVAAASLSPSLTLTPNGTPSAGTTNYSLGYDLKLNPSSGGETAKSITTSFPAGLLSDSTLVNSGNGQLCLQTSPSDANATNASCQIATGTAAVTGVGSSVPTAEYLVQAPNPSADVAGVLLVVGGSKVSTADVTVRPADAGLNVAFSNLPPVSVSTPQITELNLTLTHVRLPSSCNAASMTVQTVAQPSNTSASTTSNSITPTGCPSQAYSPNVTAKVAALGNGGAHVSANITQAADEAASKKIELDLPSSLSPNLSNDAGCLLGSPCQIGTASALTPLAPPQALANGTVTLGLVSGMPAITVAFKAPYSLSFVGFINTGTNVVTVNSVPDVPITSLSLNITDSPSGPAFNTTCQPSSVVAKFTGQGGQSKSDTAPIDYGNTCTKPSPPKAPTVSGSLSGLAAKHPVLHLHVKHGSNAPNLKSVTIGLGSGLSFSSKGLVKHTTCTGHGSHRKCKTKITAKGLSVSGGKVKSVKLSGGKLVITFSSATSGATITVRGPLLTESTALQKKVKKHKVKHLTITVRMTDAKGHATTTSLHLKA